MTGTADTSWYEATDRTWVDVFVERTDEHADRRYASCGERVLTYGELRRETDRLASGLLRAGLRPGQTVAVWMTNCIEFLVCQWAVYRIGCTLLPLYSYYRGPELVHGLRDSHASTLITKSDFAGKVDARALLLELLPELERPQVDSVGFERAPDLRRVLTVDDWRLPGTRSLMDVAAAGEPIEDTGLRAARARTSPFDVVNVMYTSGTTGFPKGGLSMHRNNMAAVHLWSELARLGPDDIVLCHVPLFTNFGALTGSALTLYAGARMVVTEVFDASESLRLIGRERVTYIVGTPEIFRMLLEHEAFDAADVSSVRTSHVAGSVLEPALMGRIIDELAPDIMQGYGMSECGGLSTATTADDPRTKRLHTIGRPLANSRVEVRDPHTGAPVASGAVGEIWLGDTHPGSCVGKGYLGSPEETAAAISPDGWFRTGDLGRFDDEGYLHFTGRLKNMLTVGGFNVYPREIERYLTSRDDVADAFVVGVPDRRLGEVPVGFVVPAGGALDVDRVLAELKDSLSSQKRPRALWILRPAEVPRTPAGKVRIGELQKLAGERWI